MQSQLWRRFCSTAPAVYALLSEPAPLPLTRLLPFMARTAREYGAAVVDASAGGTYAHFVYEELLRYRCIHLLAPLSAVPRRRI